MPYANFGNPQSLNLYSYVENNPTTMGDPDGHQETHAFGSCADVKTCHAEGETAQTQTNQGAQTQSQQQTQQSPQRGLTVGVGLAGNADVGVVKAGTEANATFVATASVSSSGKPSVGVAASGAAVAYAGDHVAAAPKQANETLGGRSLRWWRSHIHRRQYRKLKGIERSLPDNIWERRWWTGSFGVSLV